MSPLASCLTVVITLLPSYCLSASEAFVTSAVPTIFTVDPSLLATTFLPPSTPRLAPYFMPFATTSSAVFLRSDTLTAAFGWLVAFAVSSKRSKNVGFCLVPAPSGTFVLAIAEPTLLRIVSPFVVSLAAD